MPNAIRDATTRATPHKHRQKIKGLSTQNFTLPALERQTIASTHTPVTWEITRHTCSGLLAPVKPYHSQNLQRLRGSDMLKTSMTRPMSTLTALTRGEFGRAEIHAAPPPSGASFGVLETLKRGNRAYVAGRDLHVFWAWPRLAFSLESRDTLTSSSSSSSYSIRAQNMSPQSMQWQLRTWPRVDVLRTSNGTRIVWWQLHTWPRADTCQRRGMPCDKLTAIIAIRDGIPTSAVCHIRYDAASTVTTAYMAKCAHHATPGQCNTTKR